MIKRLRVLAGPNGSGKTSVYRELRDKFHWGVFVNADEIAKGLSPFNPEGVAIEAGRLMLQRIDFLLEGNESFSIETTLSTRSYINLIDKAHAKGFEVSLLFFWLTSPELAVRRVAQRVREGGHNIPIDTICRRYQLGIDNLFKLYMDRVDYWMVVDNAQNPRVIVADSTEIFNMEIFSKIKEYVK